MRLDYKSTEILMSPTTKDKDEMIKRYYTHMHARTHARTHTHTQPFNGLRPRTTRVGRYQKKHSPIHAHPNHRTSFINFLHLLLSTLHSILFIQFTCLTVLFDNLSPGPLWTSSWVLNPLLHTSCISSPNRHLLFTAHAQTNAACSAVIPMLSSIPNLSLSSLLGNLSFSLMPHVHLTILISAC